MLDTDTLIIQLRSAIGVELTDPGWGDDDCLLLLNRSWWELMNKLDYKEKESQTSLSITAGQYAYTLPNSLQAIEHVAITADDGTSMQELQKMGLLDIETWSPNNLQGLPSYYYHRNGEIRFAPPPDKDYTATIYHLTTLEDLISGSAPPIPEVWGEIILMGAIWRGYSQIGDLDRSNLMINQQTRLINTTILPEEIEIADTRNAGVQVGRPYNPSIIKRSLWR